VIGESTADGGLREYALIPEYAENPEIPVAPSSAYPEEESSNNASPEEAEYVLSAEKPTSDEAAGPSNTVEEQTPRTIAAVPSEDSEEDVVPMARTVPQRRLKRKRALSPESD
jgi:hypothetical protein